MKQALRYGKLTWSYDDFDPEIPCIPCPLLTFSPVRVNHKVRYPHFSDKVSLAIIKLNTPHKLPFRDAYLDWIKNGSFIDRDLGEGRSFLRWLQKNEKSITWKKGDFQSHAYFNQSKAPEHESGDEMAIGLSFAIQQVTVNERKVKLYLPDEAMLNLLTMPFGEEEDFIVLVKKYVSLRFQWQSWRAPAPPFLEWVKAQAKRPVFSKGQLGFCY